VVPFGSNGPEGVRTVMADFSDPQRVRDAVAAVHPSVDDLLIAPTDDPLAKGTPQNASQLLAAFMTAQVSLATTMALLVSGSGSVTLVGSARCTPNSQLDDWFRKGIAQVTPTLAPRRVSLAIPGSSDSAATWLLSVFAPSPSPILLPNTNASDALRKIVSASQQPKAREAVTENAVTPLDNVSGTSSSTEDLDMFDIGAALALVESGPSPSLPGWTGDEVAEQPKSESAAMSIASALDDRTANSSQGVTGSQANVSEDLATASQDLASLHRQVLAARRESDQIAASLEAILAQEKASRESLETVRIQVQEQAALAAAANAEADIAREQSHVLRSSLDGLRKEEQDVKARQEELSSVVVSLQDEVKALLSAAENC